MSIAIAKPSHKTNTSNDATQQKHCQPIGSVGTRGAYDARTGKPRRPRRHEAPLAKNPLVASGDHAIAAKFQFKALIRQNSTGLALAPIARRQHVGRSVMSVPTATERACCAAFAHSRLWHKADMPGASVDVRFRGAGSSGRRNTGVKSLLGFRIPRSWPLVELACHLVQIGLRIHR